VPGQVSDRRLALLGRWRLAANERVSNEYLSPTLADGAWDALQTALHESMATDDSPGWYQALDGLFLYERVQRWAGAHASSSTDWQPSPNALLGLRYIQHGLSTRTADRRGGRLMSAILTDLDPSLASTPLDTGLVPERLSDGRLGNLLHRLPRDSRATTRKVGQRLGWGRKPPTGSAGMLTRILESWKAEPPLMGDQASHVLSSETLSSLRQGQFHGDAATASLVANVSSSTRI
jgi:asparagine synthase (glutamine-hydrolysing)